MNEPSIKVGILRSKEIQFEFQHHYRCLENGEEYHGIYKATTDGTLLHFAHAHYPQLHFLPLYPQCSFRLQDVIIGINFHWQRKECQSFNGILTLQLEEGEIRVINELPVEQYLASVIASEMNATASLQLLKAHAVISRSWLLAQLNRKEKQYETIRGIKSETEHIRWYDRDDHLSFDVCADDHCQRYQGIDRGNHPNAHRAVNETRGEILEYAGKICDARFSKCCGGISETFESCWEDHSYPYLQPIACSATPLPTNLTAEEWMYAKPQAFCNTTDPTILNQVMNNYDCETSHFFRWTQRYTQTELSELLHRRSGIDFGIITALNPIERGSSQRIVRLQIVGTNRTLIIGKELEIRRSLSESHLYSSAFTVEISEEDEETFFTLHGAGWGHGVGLCQIGAAVMGHQGYDYQTILRHYYKEAAIVQLYQ